jgi:hypothetical protein
MATVTAPTPTASGRIDRLRSLKSIDTAHIIEAGGNTTSSNVFPAVNAAKSYVWKTLQGVSFRIKTLHGKSRPKSHLLKTLTQIAGKG